MIKGKKASTGVIAIWDAEIRKILVLVFQAGSRPAWANSSQDPVSKIEQNGL
jgi:hypothetical protein